MRPLALVCCLTLVPGIALAQSIEVGGRVASGCVGSDGSICGNGASALTGMHASVWLDDRFEIGASLARLRRPSESYPAYEEDPAIRVTARRRDFLSLTYTYHFAKGQPVRPMLGLGSGWMWDRSTVACEPTGCQADVPPWQRLGRRGRRNIDVIFIAGLSGVIHDRWVLRGGWQSHRLANDENSTQELFLAAGYRFGR